MIEPKQEKYITLTIVAGFTIQFLCYLTGILFFPPDLTGEFPAYSLESNLIIEFGMALNMASASVMAIKLSDDRKILSAGGFTMFAIAIGLSMSSIFETLHVYDKEAFEKSYFINTCSNFLYIPAILLISTYDGFRKSTHVLTIITAIPMLISSTLFVLKYTDYIMLDTITLVGYVLLSITQLVWAINVYLNHRALSRDPVASIASQQ